MSSLDTRLLAAHAANDKPGLVALYTKAADEAATLDAACFYLTHAYIYALELDHGDSAILHRRLARHQRV